MRRLIETELVAVDDMMPQVLLTKYFLYKQGVQAEHIVYQDNTSAQRLQMHGRTSSGKRTKHMNVRYFFIKDMVDAGDFKVNCCPTNQMWGDYFTKPLQGKLFQFFRALVMGFKIKTSN